MLLCYPNEDLVSQTLRQQATEGVTLWKNKYHFMTDSGKDGIVSSRLSSAKRHARWRAATGPITAIITGVTQIGRDVPHPDSWVDHNGDEWAINDDEELDCADLCETMNARMSSLRWKKW